MTSTEPHPDRQPVPMVRPFPQPGNLVQLAYRELHQAVNGTAEMKENLRPHQLPRPWDPSTCVNPELRNQLWTWLDQFVLWLNHQHTWDLDGTVPSCWPHHPHLIREIALLADQRRRAALALNGDSLEDWHRYALPAFQSRMQSRLRHHCDDGHQPWPGRTRFVKATSHAQARDRADCYIQDHDATVHLQRRQQPDRPSPPHLTLLDGRTVDAGTGEVLDDEDTYSARADPHGPAPD